MESPRGGRKMPKAFGAEGAASLQVQRCSGSKRASGRRGSGEHGAQVTRHEGAGFFRRHGLAQPVALDLVAAAAAQPGELRLGLHPLATTPIFSPWASVMIPSASASAAPSCDRSLTKERSIFTVDSGKRFRYD